MDLKYQREEILSCKGIVDGPFAVVNADDYYGVHAFRTMYDYLSTHADDDKYRYAMVGYILENTLTENGYVSRGICETDADGSQSVLTSKNVMEALRLPKMTAQTGRRFPDRVSLR